LKEVASYDMANNICKTLMHGYCVYSHADWSHAYQSVEGRPGRPLLATFTGCI
jgi:hypothetical protein